MSLRNRLMALSLLTLLLPWSGWKLLQELESFLREAQENALLSTARTLAGALPFDSQRLLLNLPGRYLVIRELDRPPELDGFNDDWPDAEHGLEFSSSDNDLNVSLLAGLSTGGLYLLFQVDSAEQAGNPQSIDMSDSIELWIRSPRELLHFKIQPEAPGPVQLYSENDRGRDSEAGRGLDSESGRRLAEGYWRDTVTGYQLELSFPGLFNNADIDFVVTDDNGRHVDGPARSASAGNYPAEQQWLGLVSQWHEMSALLTASVPESSQAWLVNQQAWVLADSGPGPERPQQQTTWLQRWLYRLVAGSRTTMVQATMEPQSRLQSTAVTEALAGTESRVWTQDFDTAVVFNTVAIPVRIEGQTRGAIVLQSASEGLLLVTNRALARLLFTTLAISLGLAGGLWFFATRLSQRVRRLSTAVSEAMEDGVAVEVLPLVSDRDELGALARNNAKLLRAVAQYNQYLQTLAGKLSHELKTPLAITRSSLDNLSSQTLSPESRRFLVRAQEGVERQAAIVRAMSEANRLEAAIRVAEWEQVDLVQWLAGCAEAYRAAHPGRHIETRFGPSSLTLHCSPELLTQALDKLVDNALTLSGDQDVVTLALTMAENRLQLAVRNTGTQLPDEFQQRLFDSLVSFREKQGSTPHLGLGLYIVRLVAESHGGSVTARNLEQTRGVEFAIYLPLSVA